MEETKRVAITGAAGNLGSLIASGLINNDNIKLNLLIHKKALPQSIESAENVSVFKVDLADETTLDKALKGVDVVIHFAGVLFKASPEKFLPETNTIYFKNLLNAAARQKVKRVILISFPHVEGETFPYNPAKGRLDGAPKSVHAKTRLEEEKLLFEYAKKYSFEPVSLRVGMVYGREILMIDAALWLARKNLLGVWKKDTHIHLISKDDFVSSTIAAATKNNIKGIYHIGDEGVQTLQNFLDDITGHFGYKKPWRMPVWMIMTAARACELFSKVFKTTSPLTKDFITIGMASYYGDTSRMRAELLPELKYKNYKEGISLFD